ncbi:MAG TPA: AAA family ATPase [Steroidobacteraceae bacterium]|nr:AAA family ATPase [Steroidobacteraceae bacterium]
MYESHYRLREKPFALAPDPAFLFPGRHHRRAATLLEYALHDGTGFALVTGRVGCGKTTVVRSVLSRTGRQFTLGLIANTHSRLGALLPWVARAVGMKHVSSSESELYDDFVAHLMNEYGAGRRVALIVDEAQNLSFDGLEELRVLSNVNTGKDLLLQTILIGQPELRATLAQPRLQQFAQRISIEYHMDALSLDETRAYVAHRVQVAGGEAELFAVDAVDLVHAHADGVPRVINQLCESALVYAFADQRAVVDAGIVRQVIDDRRGGGLAGGAATGQGARAELV